MKPSREGKTLQMMTEEVAAGLQWTDALKDLLDLLVTEETEMMVCQVHASTLPNSQSTPEKERSGRHSHNSETSRV